MDTRIKGLSAVSTVAAIVNFDALLKMSGDNFDPNQFAQNLVDSLPNNGAEITVVQLGSNAEPAIRINTATSKGLLNQMVSREDSAVHVDENNDNIVYVSLSVGVITGLLDLNPSTMINRSDMNAVAGQINDELYFLGSIKTSNRATAGINTDLWMVMTGKSKKTKIALSGIFEKGSTKVEQYAKATVAELGDVVGFSGRTKRGERIGNIAFAMHRGVTYIISGGNDANNDDALAYPLTADGKRSFALGSPIRLTKTPELRSFLSRLHGIRPTIVNFSIVGDAAVTSLQDWQATTIRSATHVPAITGDKTGTGGNRAHAN